MQSRSLKRGVTALLVGVLAVAGCSGRVDDAARGPTATVRNEPATTTTSVVPVDQVPGVIDVAYVQRVIDALDQVEGDAVRALVAAKAPDGEFHDGIRAIYLDPQFDRVQASYGRSVAQGMVELRADPGDPVTSIDRLIKTTGDCVFAAVTRNFGALLKEPPTVHKPGYIGFGLKQPERDPARRNPTAWMIGFDGTTASGKEPRNPCV